MQPRREECFHEYVKNGDKINMMYEVAEGGFLDIDVRIINARNALVYDKQRETSGKVSALKYIYYAIAYSMKYLLQMQNEFRKM